MSFVDYGLNIFPMQARRRENVSLACGDCHQGPELAEDSLKNPCCHIIVEHLINLGTCTEIELLHARRELHKYKQLQLTDQQIDQLRCLDAEQENVEKLINVARLEVSQAYISEWDSSDTNDYNSKEDVCCKSTSQRRKRSNLTRLASETLSGNQDSGFSDANFRTTIIEKDSEIICLKNENALKKTEIKELEENNKKLEEMVEKMKSDIEILESDSRVSQAQIQDVILQKNEELEILRQSFEKLEKALKHERQSKMSEIKELEASVQAAKCSRKNLIEELKIARCRIDAIEASRASQESMTRQLQQERDSLDKQNREQENEIDKLLKIIERLNDKYEQSKADLASLRAELETRERTVGEYRAQLEAVEQEVSRFVSELAACLGRLGLADLDAEGQVDLYTRARQLTRGLDDVVREHGLCQQHRAHLLREIDAARQLLPVPEVQRLKDQASRELDRLRRVVVGADNYRAVKTDLKNIVEDLLLQIDSRRIEKAENAYLRVANEASLALRKLHGKINDHEVYRKCESFLLLELENLQEALNGAVNSLHPSISISELKIEALDKDYEKKLGDIVKNKNYPLVESMLSKKILQRVQNSTQIIVRITTALRDESASKIECNEKLESRLQQALLALNKMSTEKVTLQNEYDECRSECKKLVSEIENLKTMLNEKTNERQTFSDEMQMRFDSCIKENEALHKKVSILEKKLQENRTGSSTFSKKNVEVIVSLKKEIQNKESKLNEYCKLNDFLNAKLEESKKMIKQLQSTIVQENMRKVNLDNFTILHNKILELIMTKEELRRKISRLEPQLLNLQTGNDKLEKDLTAIMRDNDNLAKCVQNFKNENELLEANFAKKNIIRVNLGAKCDKLIEKVNKFSKLQCKIEVTNDIKIGKLEDDLKNLKDKLCRQKKELMKKEKEIQEKNNQIEQLNNQIKSKEENETESSSTLLKRIEILIREKSELKDELKQTLMKYEDKLAEMHKQYKHNEIELHKNHNDSIRRLEAKYLEMLKDEGRIYHSQNWLQSLNPKERQELHDKICKTPLCSRSTFERDVFEEQKRKNEMKNAISNYSARKINATKKVDAKNAKNLHSNVVAKVNSRLLTSVKGTYSVQSIIIPEKEYSHTPVKSVTINKNK